jgi:hypothetical protein
MNYDTWLSTDPWWEDEQEVCENYGVISISQYIINAPELERCECQKEKDDE